MSRLLRNVSWMVKESGEGKRCRQRLRHHDGVFVVAMAPPIDLGKIAVFRLVPENWNRPFRGMRNDVGKGLGKITESNHPSTSQLVKKLALKRGKRFRPCISRKPACTCCVPLPKTTEGARLRTTLATHAVIDLDSATESEFLFTHASIGRILDEDSSIDQALLEVALLHSRVHDVGGTSRLLEETDLHLSTARVVVWDDTRHVLQDCITNGVVKLRGAMKN